MAAIKRNKVTVLLMVAMNAVRKWASATLLASIFVPSLGFPTNESEVARLTTLLNNAAQNPDANVSNPDLLQELQRQRSRALAEFLDRVAASSRSAAAIAARQELEAGSSSRLESLLHENELAAAARRKSRAAQLARQQGALAWYHDIADTLSAYRRAADYEPGNLENWWVLGDLALANANRDEGIRAYTRMSELAALLSERKSVPAKQKRHLSIAYRRIGDLMLIAERRTEALAIYQRSLALVEQMRTRDPADPDLLSELKRTQEHMDMARKP